MTQHARLGVTAQICAAACRLVARWSFDLSKTITDHFGKKIQTFYVSYEVFQDNLVDLVFSPHSSVPAQIAI